jgi:probable addiction module antidote protein
MARLTKNYKEHLFERLQTPEEITGYLNAAIEEGDVAVLLLALRDVAEARGIAKVAEEACLNRESLYRMLSDQGNPRLSSLFALLDVLGVGLQTRPLCSTRPVAVTATVTATLQATQSELETVRPVADTPKGNEDESTFHATDEPLAA